ncbi:hypothetical protein AGOR_G00119300 [Albula goreensis]|uniref:RNA-binding protein 42 n=1 Tax=Albula goreensis TaxID=1534307 RepID=A0A8T3DBW5_9TELE|nr:hypothetical protein AGOR_G00119300 [Albula goreensis]
MNEETGGSVDLRFSPSLGVFFLKQSFGRMAVKSGEERLKEMEAEMALFEQEVLGGPVPVAPGSPAMVEAVPVPVALAVPTMPVVRPIIGTNTYRQVQQSLEARAATFVGPPPPAFVGPESRGSENAYDAWTPAAGHDGAPAATPSPSATHDDGSAHARTPQHHMGPVGPMAPMATMPPQVGGMSPMVSAPPRPVVQATPKLTPTVIQAAPTVYTAPPAPKRPDIRAQRQARMEELAASVAEQQAAVVAAGLLEAKKEPAAGDDSVIGPTMPEPEPSHTEPVDGSAEDKKKGKSEKVKKCIRTAAGTSWEDPSLLEWDSDDFRIFCGDLGNEVNDDILARAFSRYPSFLKAKVVRDKRTGKTKGYGFVSFKDPNDYVRAMREMNGKYVGSRPIKLRKSMWKDRNMEVVRKKQKEKKKLGLR